MADRLSALRADCALSPEKLSGLLLLLLLLSCCCLYHHHSNRNHLHRPLWQRRVKMLRFQMPVSVRVCECCLCLSLFATITEA
jgi:hypothetical protein